MLSTNLIIIKLSADNIESSKKFNLMLVTCIKTIPPQGKQGVSKKRPIEIFRVVS